MIKKEFSRLKNAFLFSMDGIAAAWKDEGAFRSELFVTPVVILAAFFFTSTYFRCLLIIGSWMIVLLVELLNTGIEAVTDLACNHQVHPLAKKAKDTASAAVMFSLIMAVIFWIAVLVF